MTDYTNGIRDESPSNLEQMTARIADEEQIQSLIGTTIHKTVSQYHSMLRKGLEQEVERILTEFSSATADIELIVSNRVKSRLESIVREEVQRLFDAALSSTNESIFGPIQTPIAANHPDDEEDSPPPPMDNFSQEMNEVVTEIEHKLQDGRQDTYGDMGEKFRPSEERTIPGAIDEPIEEPAERLENRVEQLVEEPEPEYDVERPVDQENALPELDGGYQLQEVTEDDEREYDANSIEPSADPEPNVIAMSDAVEETSDELFEGTVRLNVEANDCIGEVVHFVRELRQKPQLRLLRMVGNNKDGVDIWLGLREPLQLKKLLPQIEGVSVVSSTNQIEDSSKERILSVHLEPRALEESTSEAEA